MDIIKKLLSLLLTAAILCSLLLSVAATETEAPTETTEAAQAIAETEATQATEAAEETSKATEASEETEETEPEETEPEETEPEETLPPFSVPYNLYFGLLHSHTALSSGKGTAADAYAHADQVAGLDFLAITDTSHSFDDHKNAAIDRDASAHSKAWAEGIAAAKAATTGEFAAIFGYEMSWLEGRRLGHVITFNTPGFQSTYQEPYEEGSAALEEYYKVLTKVPESLSILCHPGAHYGNFQSFGNYKAKYDDRIHLLEVTDEMGSAWSEYDQALKAGWHVAPSASQNNHDRNWGDANGDRTVILAEELTRESLFEAIRSHRVYATRDKDLHLYYTLDGEDMGGTLTSVENPELFVTLYDPTDSAIGTVEVITEAGSIASRSVSTNYEELTIPIQGRYRYYYLRITQPDGDIAVTAPVWTEDFTDMGISTLECTAQTPTQGEEIRLELTLYNEEPVELTLSRVEIVWDGKVVYEDKNPGTVPARDTLVLAIPYTHPETGSAQLQITVTGAAEGEQRSYSEAITLRFLSSEVISGMLVDGTHGYESLDTLSGAVSLAADGEMTTTLVTGAMPRGGEILLIPGMKTPADADFLRSVAEFLQNDGILILWPGKEDTGYENQLLEALGSTMRFGAAVPAASCTGFNKDQPWTKGLTKDQIFRHSDGYALDPGEGSWLMKIVNGPIVMGWEDIGGGIFAAGSPFLQDDVMPLPDSIWAIPRANQTIFQKILGTAQTVISQSTIRQARRGTVDKVYRIKGYVTAGTANPNTIFPDTIYLQDDTGGIAVTGYTATDLQIGKPMEVIGVLKQENGNPVLSITHCRVLTEKSHRYSPEVMTCQNATNYLAHGGELVKIQGKVTKRTLTKNKKGILSLTVKDSAGDTATVLIEDTVLSGSTGKNTLASKIKVGRTVRVIGILHKNAKGEEVIRVRNCDEVEYIKDPKKADPSNPPTGDPFRFLWFLWK